MKIAAVHCRLFPDGALEVFKDLLQQELRNDPKAEIKIAIEPGLLRSISLNDNGRFIIPQSFINF